MVATVDKTKVRHFAEKKTVSIAAARIKYSDITGQGTADINQLFKLPANCLIIDAGVVIDTVANSTITVDFGVDGGTELGSAIDIHTAVGYKQVAEVSTVTTLTGTVTALTLASGTPNTLTSGTVALTSGAGTVAKAPRILTSTGKNITAVFSAVPTAGDFTFLVHYIEYRLGNGDMTPYVAN